MARTILVYGDSNVWGYSHGGVRLPEDQQWVQILQKRLAPKYMVVQEGLPGRIAGDFETQKAYLNGWAPFEAIVRTAEPLDLVIVALGTNDLKRGYKQTGQDIARNLLWYKTAIGRINPSLTDRLVYILPPNFTYREGGMSEETRSHAISMLKKELPSTAYLSPDSIDISDDGVHFSRDGHRQMANMVDFFLKQRFPYEEN